MLYPTRRLSFYTSLVGGLAMLSVGCSRGPSRAEQPGYASNAGEAAVEAYDEDGDNAIGGAELDSVPGLRESLGQVDADGNGLVTAEEIDARIKSWQDSKIGEMALRCEVKLDGSPLPNARIEIEPEPFLGSNVNPGSGLTGTMGEATVSMAPEHLADKRYPGVACGWYKVRVTCDDREIPAQYNTQTTLGCEVAMSTHWTYHDKLILELKSR